MAIETLDDPFADYPDLKKERDRLKRLADFEANGATGRGGYRPNAGAPKKDKKTLYFKILIDKSDEPFVVEALENIRSMYGH